MADYDTAKCCFQDALDLWTRSGAPFESALARLELARTLLALGRSRAAEHEAREAAVVLQQLGALPAATQASMLVCEIEAQARARSTPAPGMSELTPRELEVLRLIAAGRRNQDIAQELVLSVRTVERHISNIYAKVGGSGATARATATAYALRHALL
jgi:DNA-binding NarL/FixJ family response regulator